MLFPNVTLLAGGGGMPGLYAINFDPTVTANLPLTEKVLGGSILFQYGSLDANCVFTPAAVIWMVQAKLTCDAPTVAVALGIAGDIPAGAVTEAELATALSDYATTAEMEAYAATIGHTHA